MIRVLFLLSYKILTQANDTSSCLLLQVVLALCLSSFITAAQDVIRVLVLLILQNRERKQVILAPTSPRTLLFPSSATMVAQDVILVLFLLNLQNLKLKQVILAPACCSN